MIKTKYNNQNRKKVKIKVLKVDLCGLKLLFLVIIGGSGGFKDFI